MAECRCLGDKLWWADQGTDQIGTCDKSDGGNWKVLRNSTAPMMHMKIYNETVQTGVMGDVCVCGGGLMSISVLSSINAF